MCVFPAPAVFSVRDLPSARGRAGEERRSSRGSAHLLPSGAGQTGVSGAGPGALLRTPLEEESNSACRHSQIHPETERGESGKDLFKEMKLHLCSSDSHSNAVLSVPL